jgi:hypothetical protein
MGLSEDALAVYSSALQHDPWQPQIYMARARIYRDQRKIVRRLSLSAAAGLSRDRCQHAFRLAPMGCAAAQLGARVLDRPWTIVHANGSRCGAAVGDR